MIEREKEVQGKYSFDFRWLIFIPIILLLGVVPLIVRLVKTDIAQDYILYITGNNIDFFTQYKAQIIIVSTILMVFLLFLVGKKEVFKQGKIPMLYYAASVVLIIMTVLSTVFSPFKEVAMWGLPNHAEGMVIILCYILMMLYTYYCIQKTSDYKYILMPLAFLVICLTFIGYFQYIGKDLFMTEWGSKLIIPEHYAEDRGMLQGLYEGNNIYGTLFHYNYMGSFAAMMVPLFITLTCFIKGYKNKILLGILSLCSLFLLFGSTSRAGLIGLSCSVLVFIIIFGKSFLKYWKGLMIALAIGIISIVGLNAATGGQIFSRIPTLFADIKGMLTSVDESFNYKADLPIQDIVQEEGKLTIKMKDKALTLSVTEEGLTFEDEAGNQVIYIYLDLGQGPRYYTQEPKFEDYVFYVGESEGQQYLVLMYQNIRICTFRVDTTGVVFVDNYTQEPKEFKEPPTIGFKGKERMGSARGYIWSRSLPLLKDTLLLGVGPDAYAFAFPQDDFLGKWYAYDTPNMIVDKPHNLYLQIAINEGVIALIAFLVLVGTYVVQGIRLYALKKGYSTVEVLGSATLLAIIGYLGAGIFNDSVVPVAPIFWILLGTGMAINYIVAKERRVLRSQVPHATINMQTKKHI